MIELLRSSVFAAAFGIAAFLTLAFLSYSVLGWFGVGLLGLVALSASLRAELYAGHGNVIEYDSHRSVEVYARQLRDQRSHGTERDLADAALARMRKKMFRVINTFLGGVMVLGFGKFMLSALGY